jgi:toxin-antitoxin system PIN domain toxin
VDVDPLHWFNCELSCWSGQRLLWTSTNPRVYPQPLSAGDAWQQVEEWLAIDTVWIPHPTERHAEVLGRLLRAGNATANLVPDAHLAALAIEHGLVVCSTDSDFARFTGVRWENPLAHETA